MKRIIILTFFMIYGLTLAQAQEPDTTDQPFVANIQLTAKALKDSIALRWAPDKPGAWLRANEVGYFVERARIDEEGNYDPATFERLTPEPLKPWPLDEWAEIAGEESDNPAAAVAAQTIYGESININPNDWIEMADDLANRWSFALLAADISGITADALGLRYIDKGIAGDQIYVYRVVCPVDTAKYTIIPGYAVVNSAEIETTPPPVIDNVIENEFAIQLRWRRLEHDQHFSAYYIERAAERKGTYVRLNDLPYIQPNTQAARQPSDHIIYTDSLEQNYRPYYYRIVGITPFGELSPPSEVVVGMGRDRTPPPPPSNVRTEALDTASVRITWEMPEMPPDLAGFYVGKSLNSSKGFEPLFETPLPPETRSYVDENVNQYKNNYYIVGVVDTAGNGNLSLVEYGEIRDSIPPAPPTGLKGSIDSTGIVKLSWDLGSEPDLLGYQVYFSNDPEHVFSQITKGPWQDTTFVDTVAIRTLTEEIYYKIVAVDMISNYSRFSGVLKLERPDVVPPTTPIFSDYKISDSGIDLHWIPSSSSDVVKHNLYRRSEDGTWRQVFSEDTINAANRYLDEQVEPNSQYQYALEAVDDDSLRSERSAILRLRMIDFAVKPSVQQLFGNLDLENNQINLNWNYPYNGDYRFVLYRAVNGSNFVSYNGLEKTNTAITDHDVSEGNTYEYTLQAVYSDGKKSPFGKILKVAY